MAIDYERIDFQDKPSTLTPMAARILNRIDKAMDDVVTYLNKSATYIMTSSGWTATGETTYPYIYEISTNKYANDDTPIAQVYGTHDIDTADEIICAKYIGKVIVNTTGVKVYATNQPTVDLKLVLKM